MDMKNIVVHCGITKRNKPSTMNTQNTQSTENQQVMSELKQRIAKLSSREIASLLHFNLNDTSFGETGDVREMLNETVFEKIANDEIDEIEILIIESAN